MKKDRLRKNIDKIHTLEDLIDARDIHRSHFAGDIDAFRDDMDLADEIDINDALTFPHRRSKKRKFDYYLMDTPNLDDLDDDWENQNIQPSDYSHGYDEGTTVFPDDDEDIMLEEKVHNVGQWKLNDVINEPEIEVMQKKFAVDEKTQYLDKEAEEER